MRKSFNFIDITKDNIYWGDVVTRKENPNKIKEKYKSSIQTEYIKSRLITLRYLGYKYAKLLENGRVQVYGIKIEPRFIDFLDLDEVGKEYKISNLIDA